MLQRCSAEQSRADSARARRVAARRAVPAPQDPAQPRVPLAVLHLGNCVLTRLPILRRRLCQRALWQRWLCRQRPRQQPLAAVGDRPASADRQKLPGRLAKRCPPGDSVALPRRTRLTNTARRSPSLRWSAWRACASVYPRLADAVRSTEATRGDATHRLQRISASKPVLAHLFD